MLLYLVKVTVGAVEMAQQLGTQVVLADEFGCWNPHQRAQNP